MLEDNGDTNATFSAVVLPEANALEDILMACADEAARQAEVIGELDNLVGDVLLRSSVSISPMSLQKLDLFRQEVEGLASVLQLLALRAKAGVTIDGDTMASCMPLESQRARFIRSTRIG